MRVLVCVALATVLGACTIFPSTPPSLPPVAAPVIPPSKINVTLKTPWSNVTNAVDTAIPKCYGTYPTCLGTEADGHFILQRENAWEIIKRDLDLGPFGRVDIGLKGSIWRWNAPRM